MFVLRTWTVSNSIRIYREKSKYTTIPNKWTACLFFFLIFSHIHVISPNKYIYKKNYLCTCKFTQWIYKCPLPARLFWPIQIFWMLEYSLPAQQNIISDKLISQGSAETIVVPRVLYFLWQNDNYFHSKGHLRPIWLK